MAWFTGEHADRHFFFLAVLGYGLSMVYSVFLWRKGFRQDNRVNYLMLLGAFVLHTTSMMQRAMALHRCPVTNLYETLSFIGWTIVAVYLVVGVWSRLRFLGAFASPVLFAVGVFALMPALDTNHSARVGISEVWTSLHAALLSLSIGAFGLSAAAALMYVTQERNLKFHKLKAIWSLLPPIQRLDAIVGRLLLAGFILLTLGLLAGGIDLRKLQNPHSYIGDPTIIWSALVWFLYLALVLMRWRFAQGGRRFALGAIGSFVFVLLTFWGVNLLSALHTAPP